MTTPTPRPGILDLDVYVGGVSKLPGIDRVMKLSSNEGALGPSPKALAAYQAEGAKMHRYPDGSSSGVRQALAARYGLDADKIVCGAGSDELLQLLVRAYAGPGDEVLYSRHGFLIYPIAATACGATPVAAPEVNLTASVDALLAAVTGRTRILFLANPNNPTGTYLPLSELRRLRAGLPADVLLVLDAAYAEFVSEPDYDPGVALVEDTDNTVMTRTFSKLYAMGGLRLGWSYAPQAITDVLNRVRGPFNVSSAALAAGQAAVEDAAFCDAARAHNDRWLPWMSAEIRAMGLDVVPSVANFILVRLGSPERAAAADAFLRSQGIIIRAMGSYGLPDCLRITIGPEDEIKACCAALRAFLAG